MSVTILSLLNIMTSIAILFLVAAGLMIIFGLMGVVNLAHGEFIMLGAYAAYLTASWGLSPWLSLLIAPCFAAIIGLILEKVLIRYLYGKIMESILATWGIGIVIRQTIEMIFGKNYKPVPTPLESTVTVFGTSYPSYRLIIIGFAIVLIAVLYLLERKTNLGVTIRAVIQNPNLASTLGINIKKVYLISFVVGSALAGFAGAVLAPLVSVFSGMGVNFANDAFLTVLAGGAASLFGLVGSAFILGGSQSIFSYMLDPIWGSVLFIVLTMLILRFRRKTI